MRRVAVTGLGIVSCLGNDLETVADQLRRGHSGIKFQPDYAQRGFKCQVAGIPDISHEPEVPRKWRRFMADGALFAYHAMHKASQDAGLTPQQMSSPRVGLIIGSGVGSPLELALVIDVLRARGLSKVPPYAAPRIMGSTASANLATAFGIQGLSLTVASACASSGHSIGLAADQIRSGRQDMMFAGGAEEVAWTSIFPFDAMGVLSTAYQDQTASRPYDAGRDGFVISGGAGLIVLEDWTHAVKRKARIYAELTGVGLSSDGYDMVHPDPRGAVRTMRMALAEANHAIDYINTHATSTIAGDLSELAAIKTVFEEHIPLISSTKGSSGHAIGAAAVHEAIYSLLMMRDGFVAGCSNIQTLDQACDGFPIVQTSLSHPIKSFMSNSFGFGGTNASLVFRQVAV